MPATMSESGLFTIIARPHCSPSAPRSAPCWRWHAVPRRLNESRLVDFLVDELDREDEESTFYRDVQRLPAGHSLTVGPAHFAVRDYWDLKAPPVLQLRSLRGIRRGLPRNFCASGALPLAQHSSGRIDFERRDRLLFGRLHHPRTAGRGAKGAAPHHLTGRCRRIEVRRDSVHSRSPARRRAHSAYYPLRSGRRR